MSRARPIRFVALVLAAVGARGPAAAGEGGTEPAKEPAKSHGEPTPEPAPLPTPRQAPAVAAPASPSPAKAPAKAPALLDQLSEEDRAILENLDFLMMFEILRDFEMFEDGPPTR